MLTTQVIRHSDLTQALRQEILELCSDAYEDDFAPCFRLLSEATHVLAVRSGRIVSHAAWLPRRLRVGQERQELNCAYVEAVATPMALQRQGLGTRVLQAIPPLVQHFDIAALSPSAPDFYARSGWERWRGALFYTQGERRVRSVDEEVMILRLPRTPATLDTADELETDWREGEVW